MGKQRKWANRGSGQQREVGATEGRGQRKWGQTEEVSTKNDEGERKTVKVQWSRYRGKQATEGSGR